MEEMKVREKWRNERSEKNKISEINKKMTKMK
jgi:hypothetical protein